MICHYTSRTCHGGLHTWDDLSALLFFVMLKINLQIDLFKMWSGLLQVRLLAGGRN